MIKAEGTSIKAPVQLGLDKFFAQFEAIRAEEVKRADLEIQGKIAAGTATFDDQIIYLQKKQKQFAKNSSDWQDVQNQMEDTGKLREETYIQNAYKTHQIDEFTLLQLRIGQRIRMKDDSQEALAMDLEIWNIQKTIADLQEENLWQEEQRNYTQEFVSEQQHLEFMQNRLDAIPMWDYEKRWSIEQAIAEQSKRLDTLGEQKTDIEWQSRYDNKMITEEKYLSWLEKERMPMADNDIERAQIQAQIDTQKYKMKQLNTAKNDALNDLYHIQRKDGKGKAYTEESYLKYMQNRAKTEEDPLEKSKWLIKAADQQQNIYKINFEKDLNAIERKIQNKGLTDKQAAGLYRTLRTKYNKQQYDPAFTETLSNKITAAEVAYKQDDFKTKMALIDDKFETKKDVKWYKKEMKKLKKEFNQPIFLVEVNRKMAMMANDLKGVELANKLADLTKAYNTDKLDANSFLKQVNALKNKYPDRAYQDQLDEFDYNLRTDVGRKAYDQWANPIKRKINDALGDQQTNDSYMRSWLESGLIGQGEYDDYKRKSDAFKDSLRDWQWDGKYYDYEAAGGYGTWAPENKKKRPAWEMGGGVIGVTRPNLQAGGGGGYSTSGGYDYESFYNQQQQEQQRAETISFLATRGAPTFAKGGYTVPTYQLGAPWKGGTIAYPYKSSYGF